MSHKNSEFELCRGVNVLTGPNNSGKSAVVTALELLTELPTREGTYMIRHGESEAIVSVETEEGHTVAWGRKDGSSSLTINDERHTRISNNHAHFLSELHKVLKLPQVKNKDEAFDIHIANQKQPIFLLNDPPSRAATFFSVSSDAGRLVEVRDLFKTKVNKAKERKNSLERKKNQLTEELTKLAFVKEIEDTVEGFRATYTNLIKEQDLIQEGFELLESYKKCLSKHKDLEEKYFILDKLQVQKELESTQEIEISIEEIKRLSEKDKYLNLQSLRLSLLKSPPEWTQTTDLENHIALTFTFTKKIEKFLKHENSLENLKEPLEEIETGFLQLEVDKLNSLVREEKSKLVLNDLLSLLIDPPKLDEIESLEECMNDYKKLLSSIKKLEEKELKAKADLEKWVLENPTCPTCGNPLDKDHLLGDISHG
jgi:exonuclease SbcC